MIGDAVCCSGSRSIVRAVARCTHAAVGDQFGYMAMNDGRCVRFQHNGVVHAAQDNNVKPVGMLFKINPVRPAQRSGARPGAYKRKPDSKVQGKVPQRGNRGVNAMILTPSEASGRVPSDVAAVPNTAPIERRATGRASASVAPASAPLHSTRASDKSGTAQPRKVSNPQPKAETAVTAAASTPESEQPEQPKPKNFSLAVQMRMARAKDSFEQYAQHQKRRRSWKARKTAGDRASMH